MVNVNPTQFVTAIGSTYEPKENKREGPVPSEELLEISASLKEALEGLNAWVQIYPLMSPLRHVIQGDEKEEFIVSARELLHLGAVFRNAHAELRSYNQQIPEPSDASIAFDMQVALEQTFTIDIAKETSFSLPGYDTTSWGALLLSNKEIEWGPDEMDALFLAVSAPSWRQVRSYISKLKSQLP